MIVLGLHKDPWHNTGAAIIDDRGGSVRLANVAEERFDRVKDSRAFPRQSIAACMKHLGIDSVSEIDLVVLDHIVDADWRKDWLKDPCDVEFLSQFDPVKIHVIDHHLAHAYCVFYSSDFASSAVLIVDGRGSQKETQSLFTAGPGGIEMRESTDVIGIGLLYAAVTQAIGFGLLQEGKTMGLAPFGAGISPRVFEFPRQFRGIVTDYSEACVEGAYDIAMPHRPIETFEDKARAAFDVQEACEAAMMHLAKYVKESTGEDNLCISGGVALNSVANYHVLRSGLFKNVFVNPAASDTGIALGAALYGYHKLANRPRISEPVSAFLGPAYSPSMVEAAIAAHRGSEVRPSYTVVRENAMDLTAGLLAANRIVGHFAGRSEMGPRALGNRSILMSPLVAENKDVLNSRVKHREAFRPFAPAILEEYTSEYFEMDRPSPFMLFVPPVLESKRSVIPAVVHVDGTGRLQTVGPNDNPRFYELIGKFQQRTGVPVLLNTSFNDNGEPIVESPEDAVRCFLGTNIDALFIEDCLLLKPGITV